MNRKEVLLKRSAEFKRRSRAVKIVLSFGFSVFLVLGILVVLNLSSFSLSRVSVDGASTVSAEKISRAAREVLRGSYFYLIPHRSMVFFPRSRVREEVLAVSPRIERVSLNTHRGTLVVHVSERTPVALWCGELVVWSSTSQCLSLDRGGFAFGLAPYAHSGAYLIFNTSDRGPRVGSFITESGTFGMLYNFVKTFPLPISRVLINKNLRYTLYTKDGMAIFINPRIPLDQTRSSIITALSSDALASSTRLGESIEYLDVRVSGKVFYKLRE